MSEDVESDETAETVKVGGFTFRRTFSRKLVVGMPDHTPVGIAMGLQVDDAGRSTALGVLISSEGLEPLTDKELAAIDLVEAKDQLMRIEGQEMTPDRGYSRAEAMDAASQADLDEITSRDAGAALTSVRSARRRREVTPQLLARVLDLYDQGGGGIKAVMAGTNYSESYCFKLLRKARAEATV